LTKILGQSQPRVSRHLKLLVEAGLLQRFREGAWAFYRLADKGPDGALARILVDQVSLDDGSVARDSERLEAVRAERAARAAAFFRENAAGWQEIRRLYINDREVESALLELLPKSEIDALLDIGTGTGRILEVFGDSIRRGVGVDLSHEMLSVARVNLEQRGLTHCQVRLGDMGQLPLSDERFGAVTFHLALHYADEPAHAIAEAARYLAPGGRMVVVDFAPHQERSLQTERAHRWLGFDDAEIDTWFRSAGLVSGRTIRLPGSPLTINLWSAERPGRPVVKSTDALQAVSA
jgi:ArsR family transcriptional regulator